MDHSSTMETLGPLNSSSRSLWVVTALLGILGLIVLKKLRSNKIGRALNLPPGPRNLPILGALFDMDARMHKGFDKLAKKYGAFVYFRLGIQEVVIVSSAEGAKEVLKHKDEYFSERSNHMTATASKYVGFDGNLFTFAKNDAQLKLIRKVSMMEFFTMAKLKAYEDLRRREIAVMVDKIYQALEDFKPDEPKLVDVRTIAKTFPQNVLFELVFGKRYDTLEPNDHLRQFNPVMDEFLRLFLCFPLTDLFPFMRRFDPQGLQKQFKTFGKIQDEFYGKILEDRRLTRVARKLNKVGDNDSQKNSSLNFVDFLLDMQEQGGEINDKGIMSTLLGILVAGVDTTASTVEWVILELIRHPQLMKRLHAELDAVVGKERVVEEADIEAMPFLNAVVNESMRLHPVVTFTPMHVNETPRTLGGFDIPPKTAVMINIYSIQRDPTFWKDPEVFNPDRFLQGGSVDQNVTVAATRITGSDFHLVPFGNGRRSCLGWSLAMVVTLREVASLVHAFDWSPRPGLKPEDISVDEAGAFVIHPIVDLVATPTPRLPRSVYSCATPQS